MSWKRIAGLTILISLFAGLAGVMYIIGGVELLGILALSVVITALVVLGTTWVIND